MAVKLGSSAVSLYLGSQAATGYLGGQIVTATVPGAPTISAIDAGALNEVVYSAPASDGGSAITSYKFYLDGVLTEPDSQATAGRAGFSADLTGVQIEVSAVNAVGEGPKSAPFTG